MKKKNSPKGLLRLCETTTFLKRKNGKTTKKKQQTNKQTNKQPNEKNKGGRRIHDQIAVTLFETEEMSLTLFLNSLQCRSPSNVLHSFSSSALLTFFVCYDLHT